MRRLTVDLSIWSTTTIVDGGELGFADSGEVLQKGTPQFTQLRAPLHDSLHQDDPLAPALLPVYPTASDMASIDDGDKNSGEMLWLRGED
jgi:hypothetical protein